MAKDIRISSPLNGKLVPLNSINDPVFASGAMAAKLLFSSRRVTLSVSNRMTVSNC